MLISLYFWVVAFAAILGGEGTPYCGGVFKLKIDLPERLVHAGSLGLRVRLRMTYKVMKFIVIIYNIH